MQAKPGSKGLRRVVRAGVFLLTLVLIAGMVSCPLCNPVSPPDPSDPVPIQTWQDLHDIRNNLGGDYVLMNDLDKDTPDYSIYAGSGADAGRGWEPIGTDANRFTGTFDGQGHEIRDLIINRPDGVDIGLFGYVGAGGVVKNIAVRADVEGGQNVGVLVGSNWRGTVTSDLTSELVYSTISAGNVTGQDSVGGLVGYVWQGTVSLARSTAIVLSTGPRRAGGLVGHNSRGGVIANSEYKGGTVEGTWQVGGLVGLNAGEVRSSKGTGTVIGAGSVGGVAGVNLRWGGLNGSSFNGTVNGGSTPASLAVLNQRTLSSPMFTDVATDGSYVGGLVGWNEGLIDGSSADSEVTGEQRVAGLVGWNDGEGTLSADYEHEYVASLIGYGQVGGLSEDSLAGIIRNSYSTGSVTGVRYVGGMVGGNEGDVDSCFSTGKVTGDEDVGGLVGWNDDARGTVRNSFWDTDTSGQADSAGGIGRTSAQLRDINTYRALGWDICAVALDTIDTACTWNIAPGGYPFLSGKESDPAPPPAPPEARTTGPWVDEILITQEPLAAAAIAKLGAGGLDICAFPITDVALLFTVMENPNIDYVTSVGSYHEFSFNPVPFFNDGRFNPFGFPRIREAVNKLIDRRYIASEIQGGLGIPKYTVLNGNLSDATNRYPDLIAAIEAKYAYDKAAAAAEISAEMAALGAELVGGRWHYDGQEIEIIVLAIMDDERLVMGEYMAAQLQDNGFKCRVVPRTAGEAAPIWLYDDPADGGFHIYTGGGVTSTFFRDQGGDFAFFYTDMGYPAPLWLAYDTDPVFYEVCQKLDQNLFTSMQERRQLFEQALWLAMKDSVRIWLTDSHGFTAFSSNVGLAADEAGGIAGSSMWAHTVHFKGADGNPNLGGSLNVVVPSFLSVPLNPVAGSNSVYDMFWINATGDAGVARDVRDGLVWPHNFEKAEVTVKTGLPVDVSAAPGHDWVTLNFAPSIPVPGDAWADWNAATQRFIPASTRFPGGTTALTKSVVCYPKDIFETPLHDGSTLSMGDFIIGAILTFDRAKEASPLYDSSAVPSFNSFMSAFKGVRFITDNPDYGLIVETYSDDWTMDAELCVSTWWPVYAQGPAVWHTLAVAIRAEADKQLAFSSPKATELGVEWTSFIAGPSLTILRNQLTLAKAANYIPYAPTMGQFVTAQEAAERWSNLEEWSEAKGHFWVASGPFYLKAASPVTKAIQLTRFEDYPDSLGRFDFLISTP